MIQGQEQVFHCCESYTPGRVIMEHNAFEVGDCTAQDCESWFRLLWQLPGHKTCYHLTKEQIKIEHLR